MKYRINLTTIKNAAHLIRRSASDVLEGTTAAAFTPSNTSDRIDLHLHQHGRGRHVAVSVANRGAGMIFYATIS